MNRSSIVRHMASIVLGVGLIACIGTAQAHGPRARPSPFEIATINVERNDTDDDTEVVIAVKGGDEGLKQLTIVAPDGRRVVAVSSPDPTILGLREFFFESPEPAGSQILAAYPEGRYTFLARSLIGEHFSGQARLSHQLPAAVVITHPQQDAEVGADTLTIEWSAVPGVREYIVEIDNESTDPEQNLRVNVPPSQTSFAVPPSMLAPGSDLQVGIASVAENGNVVFSEVSFSTQE